jgi:large subunit ribosomal protein L13
MKTTMLKKEEINRQWQEIDLSDKILGRAATRISQLLIGKHKPEYTPHLDCGDYVVAINSKKIKVTGKKTVDKLYHRHTGYMGGLKTISFDKLIEKDPNQIIKLAVKNMLPKNKLRKKRLKRLKIFETEDHPYAKKIKK